MARKSKHSKPTEIDLDEVRAYLRADKAGQNPKMPPSVEILRDSDDEFLNQVVLQTILEVDRGIEPIHTEAPPAREKKEPEKKPAYLSRVVKDLIYWPDEVKPEEFQELLRHMRKRVYKKFITVVKAFSNLYAQGKVAVDYDLCEEVSTDILSSMSMEHGFFRRFKKDHPEPFSILDEVCYKKFSQRLTQQITDRYKEFTERLIAGISDLLPDVTDEETGDKRPAFNVADAEQAIIEKSRKQKQELHQLEYHSDAVITSEEEDLCPEDPEYKEDKRRRRK